VFGTGHHKKKITITLIKVSNKHRGGNPPFNMNTFTFEIFEYDGENYEVFTDPGKEVLIIQESDGYDVSLFTEVFDGERVHHEEIKTEMDFEDYTHEYVCKNK